MKPEQLAVWQATAPHLPASVVTGPVRPRWHPCVLQPTWTFPSGLHCLASVEEKADGYPWLHVSFSRSDRIPSYQDMAFVRDRFFRPEDLVVQVFPPREEHYNHHPNCLHLWSRIGPRPIVDLRSVEIDGQKGV